MLSQHTSDTNRDRAYADLRTRFPSWDEVADAPLPALAKAIYRGGLGPTKAVRIRGILRELRDRGIALDDRALMGMRSKPLWELLVSLTGVGPKTAACVLLFGLGMPGLPVDTHVHRVAIRLGLVPPKLPPDKAQALLEATIPAEDHYRFHVLLIRHGRHTCFARNPACERCPLLQKCPSGAEFIAARGGASSSEG